MPENQPMSAENDAAQWFEGGDGHGYRYQYIGPIHYLCECGEHFLNRERWLVHKAEAAFWLAQEAGGLPRDRGGYVHAGFIAGFAAARVIPPAEQHNHDAIGVYGNCPACGTVIPPASTERGESA